jgi:hypothetical protein
MKFRSFITTALIISAVIVSAGFLIRPKEDERTFFLDRKAHLVMREIGHHLLLTAGDTTSRILPVRRFNETIFQLDFESPFHFVPDSLIKVIHSCLKASALPLSYVVNVRDCKTMEVVYGFSIGDGRNIVPCNGRAQPTSCYSIQLAFTGSNGETEKTNYYAWLLLGGMAAWVALVFAGSNRFKKKPELGVAENLLRVGKYNFSVGQGTLQYGPELIQLSDKESEVLEVLINHANRLVQRERLLKEIWEDQGVVVGRSLDVFISKLRKKLQHDPSIRIVNVHGRGYKLEL